MNRLPFNLASPEFEQLSYGLKDDPRPLLFASVRQANDDDVDFPTTQALLDAGLIAWRVWNPKPGLKYLYTRHPINPVTGRKVSATLEMTNLALEFYGKELYDLFVVNSSRTLPPYKEWLNESLKSFVPVKAELASQMTLHYVAPAKKVTTIGKDGFVTSLSERRSNMLRSLREGSVLDLLNKWKVGPNTKSDSQWIPDLNGEVVRVSIQNKGLDEIDELIQRGFKIDGATYEMVFHCVAAYNKPQGIIKLWDGLQSKGIEPPASLWFVLGDTWQMSELVQWLKDKQVSWHTVNNQGASPLGTWIKATMRNLSMEDQMNPINGMMGLFEAFMPEIREDLEQQKSASKMSTSLILEMIEDGLDPYEKDYQGMSAMNYIFPDQISAMEFISQKVNQESSTLSQVDMHNEVLRILMLGDQENLKRQRGAYTPKVLDLIDQIIHVTGQDFFEEAKPFEAKQTRTLDIRFRR